MVVLVPVDERLTGPGAPGLAELCADGVEPLVEAVLRYDPTLPVLGLPGSVWLATAEAAGLTTVPEAFADRAYTPS